MRIIKYAFIICLLIAPFLNVCGQNKFDVGIEGSPSITFLRGNEMLEANYYPTIDYSTGFSFQYNLKNNYSLRTGVLFERKGATTEGLTHPLPNYPDKFCAIDKFDYIIVPLLFRISSSTKIILFADAGPFFGYLIKETELSSSIAGLVKHDYTSWYKRFDTGISTGLGFSIPFKEKFMFSCEIRNNLGLYNVSAVPVYNNGSIKTNSTNLIIGIAYKFGANLAASGL